MRRKMVKKMSNTRPVGRKAKTTKGGSKGKAKAKPMRKGGTSVQKFGR